jgi:hypothetical protein
MYNKKNEQINENKYLRRNDCDLAIVLLNKDYGTGQHVDHVCYFTYDYAMYELECAT